MFATRIAAAAVSARTADRRSLLPRILRFGVLPAVCALAATSAFAYQLTTTTLAVSRTSIQSGQSITLVASVAGASPTGNVRFYDGLAMLSEVPLVNGVAALQTTSIVSVGGHALLAAYQGDDANYPSSGPASVGVQSPPATLSAVEPSHLPAGTLDTVLWIRGNRIGGATVTANGITLQSQYESPTLIRAILPASLLAAPGPISLVLSGSDAPLVFTVDAAGAPPLSLAIGSSQATASHLTAGGSSAWLVLTSSTDSFTKYTTWVARSLTDSDSDGNVAFDLTEQSTTSPLVPPITAAAVVDVATGAVRIDTPAGTPRKETFFPMDAVQGLDDQWDVTRLWLHSVPRLVVWVRPGVGAWVATSIVANVPFTSAAFVPMPGSPAAPPLFWPDDVIVAMDETGTFTRGVIRDYLPVAPGTTPSLLVEDATVTEGNSGSTLDFLVSLTRYSDAAVNVTAYTSAGTALPGNDYTDTTVNLVFQPGETIKHVYVPVFGDTMNEGAEDTMTLRLASDTPILFGSATGTIVDDDPLPAITIQDASSIEGSSPYSPRMMAFPLTLSAPRGVATYGYLAFTGRSANSSDVQLTSSTGGASFTIPAGSTSGVAYLPIDGDSTDEDDETFFVDVVTSGATPVRRGTGTIVDDDAAPVVAIGAMNVVEPTGADVTVQVPFTVSGLSDRPMSFDYQLVGQNGASSSAFVVATGSAQFDARLGSKSSLTFPVTIRGDALREPSARFSIVCSNAVNVTLPASSATFTIADDDAPSRYAATILRDGPYAYYRLHESGGSVAHDSSGHGLDGTFGPTTAFNVAGALASGDPAISYGDAAEQVTLPGVWGGAGWNEATIEGWVRVLPLVSYLYPYGSLISGGNSGFVQLIAASGWSSTSASISTSSATLSVSAPMLSAGWHHVALSVRSGATVLYIDGVAAGTSSATYSGTINPPTAPVTFGGLDAQLDEVAIYKKALTAADVQRHYAARFEPVPRDFDDNGSNDLVLRNGSTGANALWLLSRGVYTATANLPYLPSDFRIEGSTDFDLDGKPDLLLRNYGNGNNAIWMMNGTSLGSIVNLPWLPTASDFRFQGTADVNGDGWPDILIRNYTNGNNAAWLMSGSTFLGIANLPALPDPNYRMAGGGDFNGDGKADILWRNQVTGSDAVWLLDGTTLLGVSNLPALPNTDYRFDAIADFDGDGKTDIALRNYATGANAFWLLDGTALRSIVNLPALPNPAYEIVGPR